jgi:hypothetical protein
MPFFHSGPFLIPAAVNTLRGTQFPWARIFLTTFFLRHATVAWRVIFLPAMVNLLLDSQLAWILPFGFWRQPAASFRSLRRFLKSSDRHHGGVFLGDFLMLRYRLHNSWIGLNLLCTGLRHFLAGRSLVSPCLAGANCYLLPFHYGHLFSRIWLHFP